MKKKELQQRIEELEAENSYLKMKIGILTMPPFMAPMVVPSPIWPTVTPPTYRDPYEPSRTGDNTSVDRYQFVDEGVVSFGLASRFVAEQ